MGRHLEHLDGDDRSEFTGDFIELVSSIHERSKNVCQENHRQSRIPDFECSAWLAEPVAIYINAYI
jgi:hypothetical protein